MYIYLHLYIYILLLLLLFFKKIFIIIIIIIIIIIVVFIYVHNKPYPTQFAKQLAPGSCMNLWNRANLVQAFHATAPRCRVIFFTNPLA